MPAAYAIAHLHDPTINDDVLEYLERIQPTLDPFGGRFLVHGATVEVREGEWPGTIVVIGFPGIEQARAWFDSPAYRAIVHLRTDHIPGSAILVEGVEPDYDVRHTAAVLRRHATAPDWPAADAGTPAPMHEPTPEDPPTGDPDVAHPDTDAEELVNEQEPGLDPAGPTELGDAIDG